VVLYQDFKKDHLFYIKASTCWKPDFKFYKRKYYLARWVLILIVWDFYLRGKKNWLLSDSNTRRSSLQKILNLPPYPLRQVTLCICLLIFEKKKRKKRKNIHKYFHEQKIMATVWVEHTTKLPPEDPESPPMTARANSLINISFKIKRKQKEKLENIYPYYQFSHYKKNFDS
jgi:hypothetical protein